MSILDRLNIRRATNTSKTSGSNQAKVTFEVFKSSDSDQNSQLAHLIEANNKAGGAYHQLNFGNGLLLEGDYNITRYLHHYHLPNDLTGKTVLDIGTHSGYFALECARRGGQVTAIDIEDEPLLSQLAPLLNVHIHIVKKDIYELEAEFGQFDLIICGSVLLHLPDQLGAIRRIYSVCKGQAVISTFCTPDSQRSSRPICEFLGWKAVEADYWTYWRVSAAALKAMFLAAGFSQVENVEHFTLKSEPGRIQFATPHVVMTAVK